MDCSTENVIYLGALATLLAYREKMIEDGYESQLTIMSELTAFLEKNNYQKLSSYYETPVFFK